MFNIFIKGFTFKYKYIFETDFLCQEFNIISRFYYLPRKFSKNFNLIFLKENAFLNIGDIDIETYIMVCKCVFIPESFNI